MLNVDYVVSGSLRHQGKRLTVAVELAGDPHRPHRLGGGVQHKVDDAFLVLDEIGRIVAIATKSKPSSATAPSCGRRTRWTRGRRITAGWHMYRFSRTDNERAHHFFETAVRLDPTFARSCRTLVHAFPERLPGLGGARRGNRPGVRGAGQSLMVDDRDPAAHWAMGRALWLRRDQDQSIVELEKAIDLSPNFALGHYALAFVQSQAGDARAAIKSSDYSRQLSPFDPLLFGMLGARAMALVRLGRFDEAADWAIKAAARPNAHAHILAIAASLALAGRRDEARGYLAAIHKALPHYRVDDFLTAMHFSPQDGALFRKAAKRIGSAA